VSITGCSGIPYLGRVECQAHFLTHFSKEKIMKLPIFMTVVILAIAAFLAVGLTPVAAAPQTGIVKEGDVCYTTIDATATTTYSCPAIVFTASHQICPVDDGAYTSTDSTKDCKRKFGSGRDQHFLYADTVTETFGPITVQYQKSQDPNHCHKPTGPSQGVPNWADGYYNSLPNQLDSIVGTTTYSCPDGFTLDGTTCKKVVSCENPVDVCSNLEGNQATVPDGYHANGDGTCTANPEVTPTPVTPGDGLSCAQLRAHYDANGHKDWALPPHCDPSAGENSFWAWFYSWWPF